MNNYKKLTKYITKLARHLKKNKIVKALGGIILFILIFDKLFILIVLTLIVQFKKIKLFFINKTTSLPILH